MKSLFANKSYLLSKLQIILHPIAVVWLYLNRNIKNASFWWDTDSIKYRPSRLWGVVIVFYKSVRLFNLALSREKAEVALEWFYGASDEHYSRNGPGYEGYANYTEEQCIATYNKLEGRIERFLKINPNIFGYNNEDTFLDSGCGLGQNINVLTRYYPGSRVEGFDVNENALRLINIGSKKNINITLKKGSVTDLHFLSLYPDNSFDHVIISHVFTFILSSSISNTQDLRQSIIDQLIRIAKKSFLIIDSGIFYDGEPKIEIECNTRCVYKESLEHYFVSHLEHADTFFAIPARNTGCLYFRKKVNCDNHY